MATKKDTPTTEEIHARCKELGIDPGKKGDSTLLEHIQIAEAALEKAKPSRQKDIRPEHVNERAAQKFMSEKYKKEPLVEISISPMYAQEFGNNHPVSLNGVRTWIPCDGKVYKVPKSFAMEIRKRIYAVDIKTKRRKRMASVKENSERTPGEIKLFR